MEVITYFDKPEKDGIWDVAIIGSGPSALTSAIYTTRGAASTIIFAGDAWGGQLMLTTEVDNFPGFPEGVMGPELMMKMRMQAERFNAEFIDRRAEKIELDSTPFILHTTDESYKAKTIIIATGAETQWLGVQGEERLRGRGVSSCAPCDAPFFKNKRVAVVGGGDSAMEEALVLTKYAESVTLIHRRDAFRASAAMQQKVFNNSKITVIWDTEVVEMKGDKILESLRLKTLANTKQAGEILSQKSEDNGFVYWDFDIDGVFIAIGHSPATDIFKGKIDLDAKGFIEKKESEGFRMKTSVDGVFVAGDVHDTHYKQAITAAGFGCMAGMEVLKYLDKDVPSY